MAIWCAEAVASSEQNPAAIRLCPADGGLDLRVLGDVLLGAGTRSTSRWHLTNCWVTRKSRAWDFRVRGDGSRTWPCRREVEAAKPPGDGGAMLAGGGGGRTDLEVHGAVPAFIPIDARGSNSAPVPPTDDSHHALVAACSSPPPPESARCRGLRSAAGHRAGQG
jgi:hypothetical protein